MKDRIQFVFQYEGFGIRHPGDDAIISNGFEQRSGRILKPGPDAGSFWCEVGRNTILVHDAEDAWTPAISDEPNAQAHT